MSHTPEPPNPPRHVIGAAERLLGQGWLSDELRAVVEKRIAVMRAKYFPDACDGHGHHALVEPSPAQDRAEDAVQLLERHRVVSRVPSAVVTDL